MHASKVTIVADMLLSFKGQEINIHHIATVYVDEYFNITKIIKKPKILIEEEERELAESFDKKEIYQKGTCFIKVKVSKKRWQIWRKKYKYEEAVYEKKGNVVSILHRYSGLENIVESSLPFTPIKNSVAKIRKDSFFTCVYLTED